MSRPKGGALMPAHRYYSSGIAAAEAAMPSAKSVWTLSEGRPGAAYHDRDNFITNRVTVAEHEDRTINEANVMGLSAAWACVNLLAGTIATLPLMVYRSQSDERRTVAKDHRLYRILHDSPNADQTTVDFLEFIAASLELRGDAIAEKITASDGRLIALDIPIPPQLVNRRRLDSGSIEYRWTVDGVEKVRSQDQVLHIRGFGGNPIGGLSTLTYAAGVFGGALAIETASAATFRNGIRTTGAFAAEHVLTSDQMDEAQKRIDEKYLGALKAGRPLLLNAGMKFQAISISPEDAQMLQSRSFSVEEICRFFGVPPFMVGHTEKTTSWGTGIEQQTIGFVQFTLRRRLKRIEQALEKQLLTAEERARGDRIEFNLEGLLRGDSKTRAEFYASGLQNGWQTINEVRRRENLPDVEGGDVPRMQMQNVPITDVPVAGDAGAGS